MTPTPKDEIETLLRLREAFDPADWNPTYDMEAEDTFCVAAHAALGPDGCVTKELERVKELEAALTALFDCETGPRSGDDWG